MISDRALILQTPASWPYDDLFAPREESLRGCVVEAVPPLRQPLPASQTARCCVFFTRQRPSNRETWACTYGSASGRQFNDLLRSRGGGGVLIKGKGLLMV